jgi:DNA-3-methyladenine glycosylase I
MADVERLMKDEGIIRNRLKIEGMIKNAAAFIQIQKEFGSFNTYVWQFVNNEPIINRIHNQQQLPVTTPQSDALAADMKKRGFKFRGSTICYANMQAVGMVNDHLISCKRYKEINILHKKLKL